MLTCRPCRPTVQPAFGAASAPALGQQPAFGAASAPAFGLGAPAPAFGAAPAPAFGAASAPAFGGAFGAAAAAPAFGAASAPAFGAGGGFGLGGSALAFGAASTAGAFGLGASTPAFGAAAAAPGSPFGGGAAAGLFGAAAAPAAGLFGGGAAGAGQAGATGSRIAPFQKTTDKEKDCNAPLMLQSISAMPAYAGKSFEELRCEDYQAGVKSASAAPPPTATATFGAAVANPFGSPQAPAFGAGVSRVIAPRGGMART